MVAETAPNSAFTQSLWAAMPHRERAKQILAAHPEVRKLFERDRWSLFVDRPCSSRFRLPSASACGRLPRSVVDDRHRGLCRSAPWPTTRCSC